MICSSPLLHSRASRGNFDSSPLLVFYEVTQACGLVCRHCRACAQTQRHPDELPTAQSLSLIGQLTEFPAPPMLVFTGGDPLERPDIFQLMEHAAWSGLDVSITPSATPRVTPDAICRLRDAGLSRMAISIDGADAATHDGNRGVAGSFERSLEILAEARAAGVPTQVNTTLTLGNLDQIESLADRLAGLGIVMWSVFFLVPVGRAQQMSRLTAALCEQAFERLWRQAQRQPYAIKTTEAPHYRRYVIQHERSRGRRDKAAHPQGVRLGINDGKGVMFVGHTGVINPSGFLPINCGIFPRDHVVTVYQQSPVFRALREPDSLEGKCGVCEFRHICGGSRSRAYAVTGNPFAEEPDCIYQPAGLTRWDKHRER